MGATAVISAYSCRINNYNISSDNKLVFNYVLHCVHISSIVTLFFIIFKFMIS